MNAETSETSETLSILELLEKKAFIYRATPPVSRANNVSFIDDDLDPGEIGGNLS